MRAQLGLVLLGLRRIIKLAHLSFHTQKTVVRATKANLELSARMDSDWLLLTELRYVRM